MTAFARRSLTNEWGCFTFEIRAVNSRYLELNLKLPDVFRVLDANIRERVTANLNRGKIECSLRYDALAGQQAKIHINQHLLQELIQASNVIAKSLPEVRPYSAVEFLRWPGMIDTTHNEQHEQIHQAVLHLLDDTLAELVIMREQEGVALVKTIEQRLFSVEENVAMVKAKLPHILEQQHQRLQEKVNQLQVNVDADRLEQEIALLATKVDVDEELDRLITHVEAVRKTLKKGGAIGRRLDFLMQELNREANTLSSKSIDVQVTSIAVDLKVLIEQMREQIQNIE